MGPTRPTPEGPALVLGGGGLGGIAWALGFLVGAGEAVPAPGGWSRVVGTSAGATVAAQLLSGRLHDAFDIQFEPCNEISVSVDFDEYRNRLATLVDGGTDAYDARSRIGRFAIESRTVGTDLRRAVIATRLADAPWPDDDRLIVTAVDANTGELVELTRSSGVSLVDAVHASCAVPGIWPAVELHNRLLIDGGIRSTCNADLAPGAGKRVVIVPSHLDERGMARLNRETERMPALVVTLDERSRAAIGSNPFDPQRRSAAALAGRRQGIRERARLAGHLNS